MQILLLLLCLYYALALQRCAAVARNTVTLHNDAHDAESLYRMEVEVLHLNLLRWWSEWEV